MIKNVLNVIVLWLRQNGITLNAIILQLKKMCYFTWTYTKSTAKGVITTEIILQITQNALL